MDNYEYIISSLPVLSPEVKPGEPSRDSIMDFIREQLRRLP